MSAATRMHPLRRLVTYHRTNGCQRLTDRQWRRLIHKAAAPNPLGAADAQVVAAHLGVGRLGNPHRLMVGVNPV